MTANTCPVLPIAQQGETVLQQSAQAVMDVHDPALQTLIDAMLHTMNAANGVGIAAPQIFVPKRVIIVASRPNARYPDAPYMPPLAMINPQIVWRSPEKCSGWEGCLSVPDARSPVVRAQRIRVRYLTREGESRETEYSDFVARIVQHECDHLDGILFVERVENAQDIVTEAEYQRLTVKA